MPQIGLHNINVFMANSPILYPQKWNIDQKWFNRGTIKWCGKLVPEVLIFLLEVFYVGVKVN